MDSHIQQTSSLVTPSIESRSLLQDGLERTDLTTPSADCSIRPGAGAGWWTPQQSPHSRRIYEDSSTDPHPNWALPTPPRSDSGFTSVSFEAKENYLNQSAGSSPDLTLSLSTNATEMSSLGFLLPSQYGSSIYEAETNRNASPTSQKTNAAETDHPIEYAMDPNYVPPMRMAQSNGGANMPMYASTTSSSNPELYQTRGILNPTPDPADGRRTHDMAMASADFNYRRINQAYESAPSHGYSAASGPTIPSINGHAPHQISSSHIAAQFSPNITRSPGGYDAPMFHPASFTPSTHAPHAYAGPASQPQPQHSVSYAHYGSSSVSETASKSLPGINEPSMRVLNQRPKPQCWDHGCNGRQFSTFSNLLRHQREKSGTAAKSYCPKCGAEFTRTTARNGHLAHDKCTKQRRESSDGPQS